MPALLHVGDAGGAFAFVEGAADGNVGKFDTVAGGAKKEAAAAHVAATDEVARKNQTVAESVEEDVAVFRGGDAAEKNGHAIGCELLRQKSGVAAKRFVITRIVFVDVDFAERA